MSPRPLLAIAAALAATPAALAAAPPPPRPHIILVALDDYGWADSWHHPVGSNESQIPTLKALDADGIDLARHYVFQYCSPSRSALHTGRNPLHVNVLNSFLDVHNPADPIAGYQGIPLTMTLLPAKLKLANYSTHFVGKSHLGMATPLHIPTARGYDTSLHYFSGANDYWTSEGGPESLCEQTFTDLWSSGGPAAGLNNSWACSQANQPAACVYEDELFTRSLLATIAAADPAQPLMAYVAFHAAHEPLQVPEATLERFAWIEDTTRRSYMAMVAEMDAHLGRIVDALKAKGMWSNTLLVAFADNGGPLETSSNFPLRGGKTSNFEGGTRGAALVSGGFVPPARRGTVAEGFIAIEDWYATLCGLAGVDPADEPARAAGLPPIDSLDVWPYLSGAAPASPRTEVWKAVSGTGNIREGPAVMQSLTNATSGLNLIIDMLGYDCWSGPHSPNASAACTGAMSLDCGRPGAPSGKQGCLFDVIRDPNQIEDLAEAQPEAARRLFARLQEINATAFQPDRGVFDKSACDAYVKLGGFYGPFLPIPAFGE